MSRNGELCLKKIIVSYSPSHGDPAVRQFFATYLPAFHQKYPQVTIDIRPRFWPETSITGVYRDGSEKAYRIRQLSSMGIHIRFHRLVNEANDSNLPFGPKHLHFHRRSVQGAWNPWLWGYESTRVRGKAPPPRWDRQLTPEEWEYHITQYAAQVGAEEEAIDARVRRHSEIPDASTTEVRRRWKQHVLPQMQSDMEFNLDHWKRQQAKGKAGPEAAKMHEYSLFSVPDHTTLGQDAVDTLRRREAKQLEDWWRQRKEQLKPPR
ncbi:unnamed protein product [Phytomonas sp. EM1]|nr:unnamed protein product [Phytomonas sp. EM1]|eukprot:CCW65619.1 unnamed protein product [Phytomonas sp. isolate EM1]